MENDRTADILFLITNHPVRNTYPVHRKKIYRALLFTLNSLMFFNHRETLNKFITLLNQHLNSKLDTEKFEEGLYLKIVHRFRHCQ